MVVSHLPSTRMSEPPIHDEPKGQVSGSIGRPKAKLNNVSLPFQKPSSSPTNLANHYLPSPILKFLILPVPPDQHMGLQPISRRAPNPSLCRWTRFQNIPTSGTSGGALRRPCAVPLHRLCRAPAHLLRDGPHPLLARRGRGPLARWGRSPRKPLRGYQDAEWSRSKGHPNI